MTNHNLQQVVITAGKLGVGFEVTLCPIKSRLSNRSPSLVVALNSRGKQNGQR
jgi:hypothetical protein